MTRNEHLLTILAEECAEVAQRASKALRFGLDEIEPGQTQTNAERITAELLDLLAVYRMIPGFTNIDMSSVLLKAKREKVEKYLAYSKECGTLTE